MDSHPLAGNLQTPLGVFLRIDDEMAELFGQCYEITFRIDDRLLHPWNTLFQKSTQEMRFA